VCFFAGIAHHRARHVGAQLLHRGVEVVAADDHQIRRRDQLPFVVGDRGARSGEAVVVVHAVVDEPRARQQARERDPARMVDEGDVHADADVRQELAQARHHAVEQRLRWRAAVDRHHSGCEQTHQVDARLAVAPFAADRFEREARPRRRQRRRRHVEDAMAARGEVAGEVLRPLDAERPVDDAEDEHVLAIGRRRRHRRQLGERAHCAQRLPHGLELAVLVRVLQQRREQREERRLQRPAPAQRHEVAHAQRRPDEQPAHDGERRRRRPRLRPRVHAAPCARHASIATRSTS
jgi:hypothetical protein